jgi:uncharacterized membrane protein
VRVRRHRWSALREWRARWWAQQRKDRENQLEVWGGLVDSHRVVLFSDAIFAIGITLLSLKLEIRSGLKGSAFVDEFYDLFPSLGAYALSYVILGLLWLIHHRIFSVVSRVDLSILVRNLAFLGLIATMPFPVRLLGDYPDRPLAVGTYAFVFIAAMLLQWSMWREVTSPRRRELVSEPVSEEIRRGFGRIIASMALVFGALVPSVIFAPRLAGLIWTIGLLIQVTIALINRRWMIPFVRWHSRTQ